MRFVILCPSALFLADESRKMLTRSKVSRSDKETRRLMSTKELDTIEQ